MSHNHSGSAGSRNLMDDMLKSPKPSHHLFLNKPLGGNSSSVSVNESTPPTPRHRTHIGHLLPRHTYFRAKILIHQVSSVPFVSGEFGVRWKLKGVQAPVAHKQGLLDRVFAEKKHKGKAREAAGGEGGAEGEGRPIVVRPSLSHNGTSTVSSRSSTSANSYQSSTSGTSPYLTASNLTVGTPTTANASSDTLSGTGTPTAALLPASTTPARGMTPFIKLKDHSVVWSQMLDPVLKFDVDRDTTEVLPNQLKLVVMQRVIPDDPDGSPQNPRLGAVYLNLAEYIGQGSVERRYLLKESKTNATLKITIEMEYIHGEQHYIPPPLAKGEILTGIAGFLDNDIVKKRPRALDIYGPYKDQEELEIDLLGATVKSARPKTPRTARKPSDKSQSSHNHGDRDDDTDDDDDNDDDQPVGVAFDVRRLPFAYGTKTTETLIEAIFNPIKITEKREESPFTYYESPDPNPIPASPLSAGPTPRAADSNQRSAIGLGVSVSGVAHERDVTVGKRQGSTATTTSSVYSESSSNASVRTTTTSTSTSSKSRSQSRSDSLHGDRSAPEGRVIVGAREEGSPARHGVRGWWKRHTRPS